MYKIGVLSFVSLALLLQSASTFALQTAAPPDLQDTILGVFPQSPKCGKSVNAKVLSSQQTADAKVEGGVLIAGEIRELWQATTCDSHMQIRYMFRLAPGKNGQLQIIGFERAR